MNRLDELNQAGQSIWLDDIRRSFLQSGELEDWIRKGVRGVTSNPSIFEKAIARSSDYDRQITVLANSSLAVREIYEQLVLSDIRQAADLFKGVYEESEGGDGYVSLEVSPALAHNTEETVEEARRLFRALDRTNVMIKIPATPEGFPAIRQVVAAGIPVNVTLIFSPLQYGKAADAYLCGLEDRLAAGGSLREVASVASLFVSRLDTAVDRLLEEKGEPELQGKIAIDNARLIYGHFLDFFDSSRMERLAEAGARVQRPLWASTGTKNPAYPDTLYVDSLVGSRTVNTLPLPTLEAVLDHGQTKPRIQEDLAGARQRKARLTEMNIRLEDIWERLLSEGVDSFHQAYDQLMESIRTKAQVQTGYSSDG